MTYSTFGNGLVVSSKEHYFTHSGPFALSKGGVFLVECEMKKHQNIKFPEDKRNIIPPGPQE